MTYLLAHDLGTTGNKATLYRDDGLLVADAFAPYDTLNTGMGRMEQDPERWWQAVCASTRRMMEQSGIQPQSIAGISFSGQMMGCLLTDASGEPLGNALIWADTRANKEEQAMLERVPMEAVYRITGHRLSASYSAAKLLWIRDHEPDRYARAYKMLNAKDFIAFRMTGRMVTDYSDASGTNLFDLQAKTWSQPLLECWDIPAALLPDAVPSITCIGTLQREAARQMNLCEGIPVVIGGGDGSCACLGAGVIRPGEAYCVLGSSSWISAVSEQPILDPQMRTFNWAHLDPQLYTPCGTMQAAGYSYEWYAKQLMMESDYDTLNALAAQTPLGAEGMLYLPYLLGERSPRWNLTARAAFIGMGASTGRGAMARAVMEGVALNLRIILEILREKTAVRKLTLIGGGAKAPLWQQILADAWRQKLTLTDHPRDATSMGAAVCAGIGAGVYHDFDAVGQFIHETKQVVPIAEHSAAYDELAAIFDEAYEGLRDVYEHLRAFRMAHEGGCEQ